MPPVNRDAEHWQAVEEATELLLEGHHERALGLLREAIEADATNPYAYFYVGTTLYELGRMEAARDAFRAAVRVAPSYLAARTGLSHALRKLGDARGAAAEALEALGRFPEDGDALYAAGLAFAERGDRRRARNYFERYLATGPDAESLMEAQQILAMLAEDDDGGPLHFD
jgi:tetratricopeptide (TPR) repeat protein